ncbi:MAG TPA: ABC transporter permease [Polyangiaceae bacterium]|nr:ABC transporter permease [Polyangiaceae bacterium]
MLTQLQVVHALLLRETKTRFGASHLGYVWAFVPPATWIGMFAGVSAFFGRRLAPPGTSVLGFLVTGIVPFSAFRETATRCLYAIESNKGLLFYPQVRPLDLVIARVILEAATNVVLMALFMGGLALYEGPPRINSLFEVLIGLGLVTGLGASLGLLCCSLAVYSRTVERVFSVVMRLIFWTSALFHPVESLPKAARNALLFNPVAQCIEIVRDGWFPSYDARHSDVWYPLAWILVMAFFGLSVERMARRRLEVA